MTKKSEQRQREEEIKATILDGMKRAHTRPEIIYAFTKLGYLVTEATVSTFPKKDVTAWDAAVKEFLARHPDRRAP